MAEDRAFEMLPDDPLGVVRHVLTHRRGRPGDLLADALDGLEVIRAVRADLDRDELGLIRMARGNGAAWQAIAAASGARTRQGAEQRALRLEAEHAGHARLEGPAREQRRSARREELWLRRNGERIAARARVVAAVAGEMLPDEDLADAVSQVTEACDCIDTTPREMIALLSLAARAHEATPPHERHPGCAALDGAASLAEEWPRPAE